MPNGHGVPLGCFICVHYEKSGKNPLMGHCQHHNIEVHMDLVCANFDNRVNNVTHKEKLDEGTLYAFIDVEGQGYPPPTELVPLEKIINFRAWDDNQRQKAWANAQKQANLIYSKRKGK